MSGDSMFETARLCDITTEPGCDLQPFNFLENELNLDGLEYHMGMSRGGINDYSSVTTTELHCDMIELFKSGSWGLLPPLDVLQKIYDLYDHNQQGSTPTSARKLFTAVLPQKEYDYELLPVRTLNRLSIYVGGVRYDYPYRNLPRIKSTIHPCFVIESAFVYTLRDLDYAPNSLADDESLVGLVSSIGIISSLRVNLSWLHGTWDDFKDRPVPVARPDPRPKRKPPPVEDANSEGYATDQPRDLNDPRILKRRKRMQVYMAKHNRRHEDEGDDERDSEEDEDEAEGGGSHSQHITLPVGRRTRSDSSSQEVVDSTAVQRQSLRRLKRLQSLC